MEYKRKRWKWKTAGSNYPSRIAISGPLGSGKTSLALYLRKMGYHYLGFRDLPEEVARKVFGMKEKDEFLITNIHQKLREVEASDLAMSALGDLNKTTRYVMDGINYPEEYWSCYDSGFFMLRIESPKHLRTARMQGRYKEENNYEIPEMKEFYWDARVMNDYKTEGIFWNLSLDEIELYLLDWAKRVEGMGIIEGWSW